MKELTLSQIAAWCGADVPEGCGETRITGVESDSRAIAPGNLFIALKGERVDGHDFLGAAAKNGAAAALVEHPVETGLPCLVVPDALLAYGKIAAGYRQLLGLKVIGITGSVGKTTTKEMTACVLQGQFRTARTDGNHNNNLGLPMSILHIPEGTEVAVLEMGMNHFGEMAYLTTIARPDLAVIANIGTMHIEHLGTRQGILQAKLEILRGPAERAASVVLSGDEPLLWNTAGRRRTPQAPYFGIDNPGLRPSRGRRCQESREGGRSASLRSPGASGFDPFEILPRRAATRCMDALAASARSRNCSVGPPERDPGGRCSAIREHRTAARDIYDAERHAPSSRTATTPAPSPTQACPGGPGRPQHAPADASPSSAICWSWACPQQRGALPRRARLPRPAVPTCSSPTGAHAQRAVDRRHHRRHGSGGRREPFDTHAGAGRTV